MSKRAFKVWRGDSKQGELKDYAVDVDKGMVFLEENASLTQGFEYFSGHRLEYDIDNNKVDAHGSEDGTQRVKFKIDL